MEINTPTQYILMEHPISFSYIRASADYNPVAAINALAASVYSSAAVLSSATLNSWYEANNLVFWTAHANDKLIGYISVLPLRPDKFDGIFCADFDEKSILGTDIIDFNCASNFFISSIVVDPRFRRNQDSSPLIAVSSMLRHDFLLCLSRHMEISGLDRVRLAGEAITPNGRFMLESLGLRVHIETSSGSKILVGNLVACDIFKLASALVL